jgi:flagellum-specific peptidoglycan hydrolase FlgJ
MKNLKRWGTSLFLTFMLGGFALTSFTAREKSIHYTVENGVISYEEGGWTIQKVLEGPSITWAYKAAAESGGWQVASKDGYKSVKLRDGHIKQAEYISKYLPVALEHADEVLPSIKIAQGVLESGSGNSNLARQTNNHFGIKCFEKNCKKGHCANYHDDSPKDRFKVFGSPEASFVWHNKVLQKDRYQFFKDSKDYKVWAKGLQKAGYATSKTYANKLINLIEFWQLDKFDNLSLPEIDATIQELRIQI